MNPGQGMKDSLCAHMIFPRKMFCSPAGTLERSLLQALMVAHMSKTDLYAGTGDPWAGQERLVAFIAALSMPEVF